MSIELVTLLAATLAAFVSFFNSIIVIFSNIGRDQRDANRNAIATNINQFGRLVHETIAYSYLMEKAATDESHKKHYGRAKVAAEKLKSARLDVRYIFWGIDGGIRTLTRLPDWIAHTKNKPKLRVELLSLGAQLGRSIDGVARRVYITGNSPSSFDKIKVYYFKYLLERKYKKV